MARVFRNIRTAAQRPSGSTLIWGILCGRPIPSSRKQKKSALRLIQFEKIIFKGTKLIDLQSCEEIKFLCCHLWDRTQ